MINHKEEINYWLEVLENPNLTEETKALINESIQLLIRRVNKPEFSPVETSTPKELEKAPEKPIEVVAGVIMREINGVTHYLCGLRSKKMGYKNVWEFPGGKVQPGETKVDALRRELKEELNLRNLVVASVPFKDVTETNPNGKTFHVEFFKVMLRSTQEPECLEHKELRWVRASELYTLNWASTQKPVIDYLELT